MLYRADIESNSFRKKAKTKFKNKKLRQQLPCFDFSSLGNFFGAPNGNMFFQNPAADFMLNLGVNQIGERTNEMQSRYWQWFDGHLVW